MRKKLRLWTTSWSIIWSQFGMYKKESGLRIVTRILGCIAIGSGLFYAAIGVMLYLENGVVERQLHEAEQHPGIGYVPGIGPLPYIMFLLTGIFFIAVGATLLLVPWYISRRQRTRSILS